jgi:hypothetical protein
VDLETAFEFMMRHIENGLSLPVSPFGALQ